MPDLSSFTSKGQDSLGTAVAALSLQKDNLRQSKQGLKASLLKPGSNILTASCVAADLPAPQPCVSPRVCNDTSSCAASQQSPDRCATLRKASLNPAVQTLSKSADAISARRLSSSLAALPRRQSKVHRSLSKSTEGKLDTSSDTQAAAVRRSRVMHSDPTCCAATLLITTHHFGPNCSTMTSNPCNSRAGKASQQQQQLIAAVHAVQHLHLFQHQIH